MPDETIYPCPNCQIGHCHTGRATYVHVYGDMLVSVPHMLAWVCDICGYQEFDRATLLRLETMMGQVNTPTANDWSSAKMQPPDVPEATNTRRLKP